MSVEGGNQSGPEENKKPPKKNWEAVRREKFFDLKFSHWVEILLTAALVGVGYLQWTVYRGQATIMKTQANISDAANRQNAAVNRAFVVPSFTAQESGTGDAAKWIIESPITNSGNTPTMDLRGNFAGSMGPNGDSGEPLARDAEAGYGMEPQSEKNPPPIQAFLGPHASVSFQQMEIDQRAIKMIDSGAWQTFLYGTVHYYDIFEGTPEHVTEFCYRVFIRKFPDGTQRPASVQCDSFNCADDECPKQREAYKATILEKYRQEGKPVPPYLIPGPIAHDPR